MRREHGVEVRDGISTRRGPRPIVGLKFKPEMLLRKTAHRRLAGLKTFAGICEGCEKTGDHTMRSPLRHLLVGTQRFDEFALADDASEFGRDSDPDDVSPTSEMNVLHRLIQCAL